MRYIYSFLLVYLAFNYSYSQNVEKIDSLQSLLLQENDPDEKNFLLLELAHAHINTNRLKSDSLARMVLEYSRTKSDFDLETESLSLLAYVNYKDEKDELALSYYKELDSLLLGRGVKNKLLIKSKLYQSQIAKFTYTKEGLLRCKLYLDEMLEISKEISDDHYEHLAYLNIGGWYNTMASVEEKDKNLTKALDYYTLALNHFLEKKDITNISKTYWFLSGIDLALGNLDKSEDYLKKRLDILRSSDMFIELGNAYNSLGGFHNKRTNEYEEAIAYYDSAMSIYAKHGFHNAQFKLDIFNGYAFAYKKMGKYLEAFESLDQAYLLKDSLDRNRSRQATIELETKYQAEKKEEEIKLLTAQNELSSQRARNQIFLLIGLLTIISLAAVFFYILYRNRQKTNLKLRELDAVKSNFFANISHEFRTPLTLIKSPLQDQLSSTELNREERSKLESIDRNADRLLSLVDQLLDLSKLESGGMKLRVELYFLSSFLEAIADSFEYIATQKNITLDYNFQADNGEVWFDKDVMEKVIVNLMSNAIKYTPDNGQISCMLSFMGTNAVVKVRNTDSSITEENICKVFDRFYQADNSSDGAGIGLALVKELVDLHHGKVDCVKVKDNMTEFFVEIPVDKKAYHPDEMKRESNHAVVRNNVALSEAIEYRDIEDPNILSDNPIMLIVEDNRELRTLVRNLFNKDYTVLEAENGEQGIEKATKYIPDVIISDVMMPIKDGVTLSQTLKTDERTSHIPIILLTAKAGDENVIKGLEAGADDYIVKPFSNEILKVRVQKLIELRIQLRQRYSQEVVLRPKDIAISSADEKFLERLQLLLDARLIDPSFNSEVFSKEIGMSRMQLHRKLKALVGLTTTEFIRSQRLKLAAHLLESTEINMSEVGYSVGFSDPSYFSKCFKEAYDCTPKQYAVIKKPHE